MFDHISEVLFSVFFEFDSVLPSFDTTPCFDVVKSGESIC